MIAIVSEGHIKDGQDLLKLAVYREENGQKKVKPVIKISSSSFEKMIENLRIFKKENQLDFDIKIVLNGRALREDGTLYNAVPLEASMFVKIKKTILSSVPIEQE